MPQPEHRDFLILGSGQGGKLLAWHLARSGQRVAVVERRGSAAPVPPSPACPARTRSGARGSHISPATPLSSAQRPVQSRPTWQAFAGANRT